MGQQRSKSTEGTPLCTSLMQPSRLHIMYVLIFDHCSDLHWSQPGEKKLTGGTNWQPKMAPSTTWNPANMVSVSCLHRNTNAR